MDKLIPWLAVGCGGFVGATLRYALSGWMIRLFPMGTLAANLLGCLLIGFLSALSLKSGWPTPHWRAFLIAGMLGSLTTFSTFAYQTIELAKLENPGLASLNLLLNLVLGVVLVWIGVVFGEQAALRLSN
ncbi:MAG: fluoride efflux transporter CrcB [Planctomycetaceae bacterium]|nr:fluoride efflux transporter CrcB [Planctomycetaceae bacterium]